MRQDIRDGFRALKASPVVSAAAIASLALGLGAATAVFSVVDGVLLKPLPVVDQDRLLTVWKSLPDRNMADWPFRFQSYEALRDRVRTVSDLAAHPYSGTVGDVAYVESDAVPLMWTFVTGGWFDLLGVRPAAGRLLAMNDDGAGAEPVMVLSSGSAVRVFGGVHNAIGRRLRIWATTYTVVGVAPADFAYPRGAEAWLPVSAARTSGFLAWHLMARVRPGFSNEQVREDLQRALSSIPREGDSRETIQIAPFADAVVGTARPALLMLGGAVLLMLVIAGTNVANLLVVRGLSRERELAIRTAIGASRGRLIRLLAAESFVIAGLSAAGAVLISYAALAGLLALAPPELPRASNVTIDVRALLFVVSWAGAGAILIGLLPALQSAGVRPADSLRTQDPGAGRGGSHYVLRHGLVIGQVALTTLVLAVAGLLLKSFDRLHGLDLGFGAAEVALAQIDLANTAGPSDAQRRMARLAERVATMPGIVNATAIATAPFAGSQGVDGLMRAEGQAMPHSATPFSNYEGVDTAYFSTLGLPVLSGRAIDDRDTADSQRVVVVNEAFARLFWPGLDPIGRRVRMGDSADDPWMTVVGLVADARYRDLTIVRPSVYVPYPQGIPVTPTYLAIRIRSATGVASTVARAVADAEPGAAVVSLAPLSTLLATPLARPRFQAALVTAFAVLAVILSVVGVYGVLSFFVRQRTREIGIRMALGANAARILGFVARRGLGIAVPGVAAGLLAATLVAPFLEPQLFDVGASDPVVLTSSVVVLLTALAAATLVPARLAARTNPTVVMRGE
jgi:putative ABC transport system permease protein